MWQDLFSSIILSRGFDYYINKKVYNIEFKDNIITSNVLGTEFYDVLIEINSDNDIVYCKCTCPHFLDGNYCKHIAATMFTYEDLDELNYYDINVKNFDIEELIDNTPKNKIKDFLLYLFDQNNDLEEIFASYIDDNYEFPNLQFYIYEIEHIIENNLHNGYIDYYNGPNFVDEINDFFKDKVDLIIERGYFDLAFEIIIYVLKMLEEIDMDGSNGEHSLIFYLCESYLNKFIYLSNTNQKNKYFDTIVSLIIQYEHSDLLENFSIELLDIFDDDEFLDKKIELFEKRYDSMLKTYEKDNYMYDLTYHRIIELANKYRYYNKWDKFNSLYNKHKDINELKFIFIDKLIDDKKYNEALENLLQFESNCNDFNRKSFSLKIKEIYKITNQNEKLFDKIIDDLYFYNETNYDEYLFIKENCSLNDWNKLKNDFLDGLEYDPNYVPTLFNEKEYKKILDVNMFQVRNHKEIWKYMINNYSEIYLDKYKSYILEGLKTTSNRKTYRYYAQVMKQMYEIPRGFETILELIVYLKDKYKARKAMIEELDKIINH